MVRSRKLCVNGECRDVNHSVSYYLIENKFMTDSIRMDGRNETVRRIHPINFNAHFLALIFSLRFLLNCILSIFYSHSLCFFSGLPQHGFCVFDAVADILQHTAIFVVTLQRQ